MVSTWMESTGPLLTILTPLVVVPLTVITFYLRSLREHQVSWQAELTRRFESHEASVVEFRKTLAVFERDYTTKEEWLRECMLARHTLERLRESAIRIETRMHGTGLSQSSQSAPGDSPEARTAGGSATARMRDEDI